MQVKASSVGLMCPLKRSLQTKDKLNGGAKQKVPSLSIFDKPRVPMSGSSITAVKAGVAVYNGIGGTTRVLQSDLKSDDIFRCNFGKSKLPSGIKKKKLSPNALNKRS